MSGPRFNRRRLLQAGAAVGAAGALPLAGCAPFGGEDATDEKHNLVFMIVDSLRPDHVGAYGSPRVRTPHIDALAAQSLRFNRAFPEAMVTVPARRSIYSGRRIFPYRDHKPVYDLGISPGWGPIEDLDQSLVQKLKDNGYRTVQIADNPLIGFTETYKPFRERWDRYVKVPGKTGERNPPSTVSDEQVRKWLPKGLRENPPYVEDMKQALANTGYGRDERETCAARVFSHARKELDAVVGREEPFAMVIDAFDPHEPWTPPPEYVEMYGDPAYEGPNIGSIDYGFADYMSVPEIRRMNAMYSASVTLVDRWLGHFMDRFYELGLAQNTIVVLMSDHGVLLGERGWVGKIPEELHPEMAQIVMMIAHPEGKAAGHSSQYFASTHDIAPTILSMLGARVPRRMNGNDLSPLLDGRQPKPRAFHYGGMFNRYFVRTDEWLLLADNANKKPELYDLTLDIRENKSVYDDQPKIAAELHDELLRKIGGEPPPVYDIDKLNRQMTAARAKHPGFEPQ